MLDGSRILRELWKTDEQMLTYDNELMPIYDNEESVSGIIYNGASYYFQKNLQGDVIELVDEEAQVVARYSYDAWGKVTGVKDKSGNAITDATHVANINPFRYRGYYFDTEIGLYYLQSRYYDPVVGRFVNADAPILIVAGGSVSHYNLLAYCKNNTMQYADKNGYSPILVGAALQFEFSISIGAFAFSVGLEFVYFWSKLYKDKKSRCLLYLYVVPFFSFDVFQLKNC